MKHKYIRFILPALMTGLLPSYAGAQSVAENETDSLNAADPLVQVAFRKVAQSDLLGGVSVVNMAEAIKKDYNTDLNSLDNMEGYIVGWHGNSLWGMDGDTAG